MKGLEIKNLDITHRGGVLAAADFSLSVPIDTVTVLAGSIGSGKSSILRAISGLIDYKGDIFWEGQDLKGITVKDRNFAYASFDSPLFESKTVEYNLAYGSMLRKEDKSKITQRIKEITEAFGITEHLNTKAKALTKEVRRRVVAARAFIRNANLYLINDLSRGLSESETDFIFEKINLLFGQRTAAMLIATSDYTATAKLNYYTAIIKNGKKVCEGNTEFYKNSPPDTFTALFTATDTDKK